MARYRKIDPRIWNDEKFRDLSDDGQLAFLFVLTHPHMTMLGAMRASISGLAEEKGWTIDRMAKAIGEAFDIGLLKVDTKASFMWAKNFPKYNKPESPNVVKSWSNALDLIPECELKVELLQQVKVFTVGLGESFAKALPEAFAKAMPNQEQEQEQEQEQKNNYISSGSESPINETHTDKSDSPKENPVVMTFPTKGKEKIWHLQQSKIIEYEDTYPGIDIEAECRKALQWCRDNTTKQKTPQGMPRFLGNWLARSNDRGTATKREGVDTDTIFSGPSAPRNPTPDDLELLKGGLE